MMHVQTNEDYPDVSRPNGNGKSLSQTASEGIQRPDYWRGSQRDALESNIGKEFEDARFAVQQSVGGILEKKNKAFKGSYVDLAAGFSKILPIMWKEGLSLRQYPGRTHGLSGQKCIVLDVHTKITHVETGQHETIIMPIPIEPFSYKDPQTKKTVYTDIITAQCYGTALTYGKRYSIFSYLGIATADTDATPSLIEAMEQPEYEEEAQTILNGIKDIQTKPELEAWIKANSSEIQLYPKQVIEIVRDDVKDKLNSLPVALVEDESQDPDQLDIVDAIEAKKGKGE